MMKRIFLFLAVQSAFFTATAQKEKNWYYKVPDSIKATAIYAEITFSDEKKPEADVANISSREILFAIVKGIQSSTISFSSEQKGKAIFISKGLHTESKGGILAFKTVLKNNAVYRALIVSASDSAANKTIQSGYVFFPGDNKWKLIGTVIMNGVKSIPDFEVWKLNKKSNITFTNRWLRRDDNTWKCLDEDTTGKKHPVLRPMSNIDSLAQQKLEEETLRLKLIKEGVTYKEGIFYKIVKPGDGKKVALTDSVTVHYRGWLFKDGSVFDETTNKPPITFPLSRLIRGWQVGVPECHVGGKIRLYIPSGSAYGIRTFATDIPPNNILVFDVEVVEVRQEH